MKRILIPLSHGKFSGQSIWVRGLMFRMEVLKTSVEKLKFVDDNIKKPALEKYE